MFKVELTSSAKSDLKELRPYEQRTILDAIEMHLVHEANVETRHRKLLAENPLATWELRVGKYRVFYDVIEDVLVVTVVAVGEKRHEKLYLRGVEYEL